MDAVLLHCWTGVLIQIKNSALFVFFGVPVSNLCDQALSIGDLHASRRVLVVSVMLPAALCFQKKDPQTNAKIAGLADLFSR
jgi:hypothetical protein